MRGLRIIGVAAVAATALVLGLAGPAAADEAKSVQVVSQEGRDVEFLVYLDPNAAVAAPGAAVSSTVVISGVEVPSEATPVVQDTAPKEAILVLDVSGSMRGPRLAAAKEAAINYVNGLPDDVDIGLVSFNDTVTVDVRPTTDKQAVIGAIGELEAGRRTALWDAMIAGLDLANPDLGARLLVLSDGGDTVSAATIDDVTSRAAVEGVPIDIVALTPTVSHAQALRTVTSASGGQFLLATDVTGLNQAFDEATGSFGGKVAVSAQVPPDVEASGKFAIVTVTLDDVEFTGTSQLPRSEALVAEGGGTVVPPTTDGSGATPDEVIVERAADPSGPILAALLVGLIVITGAVALYSYRRQKTSKLRVEQVLWYSDAMTSGVPTSARPDARQGGALDGLDEWMSDKSFYPAIDTKLDNAGLSMNVATWLMIRLAAVIGAALLLGLLLGNVLVGLIVGGLLGFFVSGLWLNSRQAARRKAFEEELPDFLMLIASSLRSGLSFQQGLDSSASDGKGEVSRQMRRALREVQMGSVLEPALVRVAERMRSDDLRWTVLALGIQREVGGNLSNILETAAGTIKGRADLRREVQTLSAEGRLSGYVLAALPVGLFLYMFFANRTYVAFFWENTIGWVALGALVILFVLGFIWMRKLVKIEV
jgi:tight adherence protein B